MKTALNVIAAGFLLLAPAAAFGQAATVDPHHPGASDTAAQTSPSPPATQAPATSLMPMMQQMMQMMQMQGMQAQQSMQMGQMMQMMQAMQPPAATTTAAASPSSMGAMSAAGMAYMAAMNTMQGPMMQGAQASDPDVAFLSAMIPHHQAAVDMAKAVLQNGKDPKVRDLANRIIAAQQAEIAQMQDWLKPRP